MHREWFLRDILDDNWVRVPTTTETAPPTRTATVLMGPFTVRSVSRQNSLNITATSKASAGTPGDAAAGGDVGTTVLSNSTMTATRIESCSRSTASCIHHFRQESPRNQDSNSIYAIPIVPNNLRRPQHQYHPLHESCLASSTSNTDDVFCRQQVPARRTIRVVKYRRGPEASGLVAAFAWDAPGQVADRISDEMKDRIASASSDHGATATKKSRSAMRLEEGEKDGVGRAPQHGKECSSNNGRSNCCCCCGCCRRCCWLVESLLKCYAEVLEARPLVSKCTTSGVIGALGDIGAQGIHWALGGHPIWYTTQVSCCGVVLRLALV